jgi:hypothetical protein
MKLIRTLALIVSATLIFTACGKDSDETAVAVQKNTNPLLVYVPADTAYVYANLDTLPKEITDAYIERFQPVTDVMTRQIEEFQQDYAAGVFEDNPTAMFASVVLEELGGSLSAENLEKFGISLQSNHAIYAMGVFPVIRFELTDATELLGLIGRIETKMGVSLPVSELNGTNYWRVKDDDQPIGIYITILDQQLAVTAFPVGAEGDLLAAFLGQDLPANSMATNNTLAKLNSEKGYSGYGSGILDLQKLLDEILSADSTTRSYLDPEMNAQLDSFDPICVSEARTIIAKAPRMTVGTTHFTANEMAMRYELEIENSLAGSLASLVSEIPAAIEGDYLFSASLALQVGKLRTFVLEKANNIIAAPYQCGQLQELNANAQQLVQQLNIPMPPMVNNLKGVRVRMNDFDPSAGLNQGNGLLALHVDKPEMFVGMASMMVPGFDTLDLANQSEPVKIPEDILPTTGMDVFALMGKDAIGAAVGDQYAGDLKAFMNMKPANDGTVFSISYDMAKQMELQEAISKNMDIDTAEGDSPVNEYAEAVRESYSDMLGRSRVDMRLTPDGLVIDSTMTFK